MNPTSRARYTLGDHVSFSESTDAKNDVYLITGVIEEENAPFDYFIARLPLTNPTQEFLVNGGKLSLKKKKGGK